MKKLFITLLAALGIASAALAQNTQYALTSITGGTPANVSAYPIDVVQLTFTASTSTNTTVKFYDSSTTATNIVRAAYGRLITYSTNWTATYLDPQGVTITNTFVGQFTTPSTVAAVTNERPVLASFVVPGSSQRIFTVSLHPARGLTVNASNDGVLETQYSPR